MKDLRLLANGEYAADAADGIAALTEKQLYFTTIRLLS